MEIKGTSVRGTYEYVKRFFPDRFEEWIENLPLSAQEIFKGLILTNKWYSLNDGFVVPIKLVSDMFYSSNEVTTGYIMGKYHASVTLTGVYKLFVRNSPWYIIEKGFNVFATYFQPAKIEIIKIGKNNIALHFISFPEPHKIIDAAISGWIDGALEISGGS